MKALKSIWVIISAVIIMSMTSGCSDTDNRETANPFISDVTTTTSVQETEAVTETTTTKSVTTTAPAVTTKPVTTTEPAKTTVEVETPVNSGKDRTSTKDYYTFKKSPANSSIGYNVQDKSNMFYVYGDDNDWVFWRFADNGVVGIGLDSLNSRDYNNDFVNTENVAYTETYCGFRATITDNRYLKVANYYNVSGYTCTGMKITFMDKTSPRCTVASDKSLTADLYDGSFTNGYYAITATYEKSDKKYNANLYLFVNCASNNVSDYEFYICYGNDNDKTNHEGPTTRQAKIEEMISNAGITPKNALATNVAYPYEATNMDGGKYDTAFWINKSYEILKGYENASNEFKATLLHDWMTENLIYDNYKVNVLGESRYYMDYVSGKYYMSKINIGVCRDFSNVYAIMCREQGIPCILLSSDVGGHVWNAAYLNGEWLEIDLTGDIHRYAETASTTDVTPATNENTHCYTHYCNYRYSALYPDANKVNYYLHMT